MKYFNENIASEVVQIMKLFRRSSSSKEVPVNHLSKEF